MNEAEVNEKTDIEHDTKDMKQYHSPMSSYLFQELVDNAHQDVIS